MDFLLPIWNPLIVHPIEQGLRLIANPLTGIVGAGAAGGLAIILFTILLRLVLVPLSLVQIRSQRHQMEIQPELKELQRKFKGDREGLARAQMQLYKERGINPAAGCLPLLIQLPILFGMYSAMSQLATQGLTLDQVTASQISNGQVVYAAERHQDPLPFNQFVLARLEVVPNTSDPIKVDVQQDQTSVQHNGQELLSAVQGMVLTPGSTGGLNNNPPNTPSGSASVFLRAGVFDQDGIVQRNVPPTAGQPYLVEIWVDGSSTNVDVARTTLAFDPSQLQVTRVDTPEVTDVAFKSRFLWLPSLGQPDVLAHVGGFGIPGLLLIIMTITSFISQRMTTMPTEDPQQQAMMRSMAFMPLMYLFFFLNTPAGLVLYWLVSNVFSMFQQYFTVGLGLLGGDIERFTGRDLQPPWAHIKRAPGLRAPSAAFNESASGASGNGRVGGGSISEDTRPALGAGQAGATRRPRPNSGQGRKRGKR